MVTSHSVALSGLTDNTTYHFRVKSKDAAANLATGTDGTFTTLDGTAPAINAVAATNITATAATIIWTTNEAADSQLEYGPTTAYGSTSTVDPSMVTSHNVTMSGLTENTTYHYRVKSKDGSGNLATGSDQTFNTADGTVPVVSDVLASNITANGATITWATNEASDSQVEYGPTSAYGSSTPLDPALVSSHSVALSNLADNTTYHFRVKSADSSGNTAAGVDRTFSTLDGTAPVISNVVVTNITSNNATITWTTDEPADGQVEWGLTTAYGSESMLVTTLDTTHSVTLTGLIENTSYHFRIKSKDSAGNLVTGTDATFTSSVGRKRGGQLTSQD